jgi:hypothetical protein
MLALALTIAHATPAAAQARWSLHLIKARDARDAFALRTCPPRHTAGRIARSHTTAFSELGARHDNE